LIGSIAAARLKTLAVFVRFGTAAKPLRDGIAGGVEGWYPGIRGVEKLCATPVFHPILRRRRSAIAWSAISRNPRFPNGNGEEQLDEKTE